MMSLNDFYFQLLTFEEALPIPVEQHFQQFPPAWNFVNGEGSDAGLQAAKKVVKSFLYYNLGPIHPNIRNLPLVRARRNLILFLFGYKLFVTYPNCPLWADEGPILERGGTRAWSALLVDTAKFIYSRVRQGFCPTPEQRHYWVVEYERNERCKYYFLPLLFTLL